MDRAEQKLSIAEAYTFGAATSRNIEGRFLSALIRGELVPSAGFLFKFGLSGGARGL